MARKSLGYVKLEWVCPNCSTRNPGPQKTCSGCGAPQPANVQFIKADQSVLVTDESEIAQAKAGPDVHCPYCGTRNTAEAKTCTQCGGDLSDAHARQSGQVVDAFQPGQAKGITCSNCAAPNAADASFCIACGAPLPSNAVPLQQAAQPPSSPAVPIKKKINPLLIILPAALALILCILAAVFLNKKTDLTAQVVDASWERSIVIEEYGPVTKEDWQSNIPVEAVIGSCSLEYSHTSSDPEPNSTEVCSTAYIEDEGTGYGEVVMDCTYQVYRERCGYTIDEWHTLTTIHADGPGLSAEWPATNLSSNQREGRTSETYTITFDDGSDIYTYNTGDYSEFIQFSPGSEWLLSVNSFGRVVDISPAP